MAHAEVPSILPWTSLLANYNSWHGAENNHAGIESAHYTHFQRLEERSLLLLLFLLAAAAAVVVEEGKEEAHGSLTFRSRIRHSSP